MKKQRIIYVMLMSAIMIAACGKGNGAEESETAGAVTEVPVVQETPEEEAEAPDSAADSTEEKADTSKETEETNMQSDAGAEPALDEQSDKQQKEQPSKQPPAEQEDRPAEQTAPTAILNGKVLSVTDGEYVVKKADVIGSDVMVSREDAEAVTVVYTDMTEFVLCTTTDGGVTADYAPATSADISSGKMTEAQGAYEGNNFVAQKVTIFHFL